MKPGYRTALSPKLKPKVISLFVSESLHVYTGMLEKLQLCEMVEILWNK